LGGFQLIVTLWGARGSIASPGEDTIRYGGNTSCVSVKGDNGTLLVLDAGTGVRCLGQYFPKETRHVNILLTHLHMDHIQGLPFFAPLRRPDVDVHIWGPSSTTLGLRDRLLRYLSPPLFPVSLRELPSNIHFHELPSGTIEIEEFHITAQLIIHPNPTLGYRIQGQHASIAYLPDHEPALCGPSFPHAKEWTSGYALADGVHLLIHDAQYTSQQYQTRIGFGHSSIQDAFRFADMVGAEQLVTFHHDPAHSDDFLDEMTESAITELQPSYLVIPGKEGLEINIGR
jgi:phosphoribosyl 1,2-cyclic phosphodiesterase